MKLNSEFILHKAETETVLVPVGGAAFSGIVKGNAILGDLLSLLEADKTEEELVAAMAEIYDAPAEVLERDVKHALEELRGIGALEE